MQREPAGSFLTFTLGFLTFIGVSFVVTFAVSSYTIMQEKEKQTAEAIRAVVED